MIYSNKAKLEKIKLTKKNFYVVIDFDKTITSNESCDSWEASGLELGEDFKNKSYELYKKYAPIELDYTISFDEKNKAMEEWYGKVMNLYYEYNLTSEKLQKSILKSNLIFRTGAKEFLYNMYKNDIPVIILSAGIGNTIKQFLQNSKCYYSNIEIISNFISFEENGNMKKYDKPIIQTLNKTIEGHITKDIKSKIKDREYKLLLGDFIEDTKMVPQNEWNETILVRIFNKKSA